MYFNPKNPDIEKIFNRLIKYPVVKVQPWQAQAISRHKAIRRINYDRNMPKIHINSGIIALSPRIKIKKKDLGFDILDML